MSVFFPYSPTDIIVYLSSLFSLDLSLISDFQKSCLVFIGNAYFFGFWFFIIYFSLKSLNWVYERLC